MKKTRSEKARGTVPLNVRTEIKYLRKYDFSQFANHSHGFFSDLRYPSTIARL
jgi:hypothetical protein